LSAARALRRNAVFPKATIAAEAASAAHTLLSEAAADQKVQEKKLMQLRSIFDIVDADGDGKINKADIVVGLREDRKLAGLIKAAGVCDFFILNQFTWGEDHLSWTDFLAHFHKVEKDGHVTAAEHHIENQALKPLRSIFKGFDADADCAVNTDELIAHLNPDSSFMSKEGHDLAKVIVRAGFNPEWNHFAGMETRKDARVTWEELEMHLRKPIVQEDLEVEDVVTTQCCCSFWGAM